MKAVSTAITISLFVLIAAASATDYCSPKLCGSGQVHIGCRNSGEFGQACPAEQTQMVNMTNDLRAMILHSHNSKRNTIAGGKLRDFKPAVRMATMRWDDELALLASYNVKTCQFAHDQCRNTNAFKSSGQNLAKVWWMGGNCTDTGRITRQIDAWWNEYEDTKLSNLEKFPRSPSKKIGHFTVMTAEQNVAIGCAAIRFPERGMDTLTLACNYATTNIIDRPLYMPGLTASKCTSGRNSQYPALCSKSEKYS